ncbi:hypothetical protein ACEPAF_7012 [Sanghuangporus sanghuang]
MSISDPEKLVAEFKKSGEFDRLRRELLQQFRDHDAIGTFMSRVQDIVQQRLAEDERLQYLSPEAVHNELMQDMDRFPLVQRSVADLPALTDPAFSASIRRSLATLLNGGDGSGKQSGGKGAENGDDVRMNDSEGSDSDSSDNDDDDENEHERESEDELMMPGGESPENERGRPDAPDVDNKSGKPKMVNGVSETTTNNDTSHSSSPTNCARAQLDS